MRSLFLRIEAYRSVESDPLTSPEHALWVDVIISYFTDARATHKPPRAIPHGVTAAEFSKWTEPQRYAWRKKCLDMREWRRAKLYAMACDPWTRRICEDFLDLSHVAFCERLHKELWPEGKPE